MKYISAELSSLSSCCSSETIITEKNTKPIRKFFDANIVCDVNGVTTTTPIEQAGFTVTCVKEDFPCIILKSPADNKFLDITNCSLEITFVGCTPKDAGLLQLCTSSNIASIATFPTGTTISIEFAASTDDYIIKFCNIECFTSTETPVNGTTPASVTVCSPFIDLGVTVPIQINGATVNVVFTNNGCNIDPFSKKVIGSVIKSVESLLVPKKKCVTHDFKRLARLIRSEDCRNEIEVCEERKEREECSSSSCSDYESSVSCSNSEVKEEESEEVIEKGKETIRERRIIYRSLTKAQARQFCSTCIEKCEEAEDSSFSSFSSSSCSEVSHKNERRRHGKSQKKNRHDRDRRCKYAIDCDKPCKGDRICKKESLRRFMNARRRCESRFGRNESSDSEKYRKIRRGGNGKRNECRSSDNEIKRMNLCDRKYFKKALIDLLRTGLLCKMGCRDYAQTLKPKTSQLQHLHNFFSKCCDTDFLKYCLSSICLQKIPRDYPEYNCLKKLDNNCYGDTICDIKKGNRFESGKNPEYKNFMKENRITPKIICKILPDDDKICIDVLFDLENDESFYSSDVASSASIEESSSEVVSTKKEPKKKEGWSTTTKVIVTVTVVGGGVAIGFVAYYFLV